MSDETASTAVKQDTFRNWLAFFLVAVFCILLPMLFFKSIASENKDTITYMLGQLSGMTTTALSFYFVSKAGQDTLDAKRADNTSKMADAVVAAANAGTTGTPAAAAADVADAATQRADEIAAGNLKVNKED